MIKKKTNELDFNELTNQVHNNNLNIFGREIYIHSHSFNDEDSGIEYKMATQFIKNLHLLNQINNDSILVHLQSPGGDWIHGMAMYDAISSVSSPVNMLAYGEISSMSSILFQVANKRIMMPNCDFLIHRGFLTLDGVSTTVQTNADWNKKIDLLMLKIYAKKAINGDFFKKNNMSLNQVLKYINKKIEKLGDWILNAEETVFYGFADGVFGQKGFENFSNLKKG
jgi:ATP-dependent protease ClpP protease subunit